MRANATCWCEWGCPHCMQATSKEKCSNLQRITSRPVSCVDWALRSTHLCISMTIHLLNSTRTAIRCPCELIFFRVFSGFLLPTISDRSFAPRKYVLEQENGKRGGTYPLMRWSCTTNSASYTVKHIFTQTGPIPDTRKRNSPWFAPSHTNWRCFYAVCYLLGARRLMRFPCTTKDASVYGGSVTAADARYSSWKPPVSAFLSARRSNTTEKGKYTHNHTA